MPLCLAASRSRCLVVAAGLTVGLWGAVAVLVRTAAAGTASDPTEVALARLCLAALVGASVWAWLQAMAGVADAWTGAPARGGSVRRLALAACGAALVVTVAGPACSAGAADPVAPAADTGGPEALAGLPLPERAEGPARRRAAHVVVRAGDSLWSIAARDLGGHARDRAVTARWHRVYATNRAVIGPDPDLIRPGQVLEIRKDPS